jgi:hypothetical protein
LIFRFNDSKWLPSLDLSEACQDQFMALSTNKALRLVLKAHRA